jgi:hypothetical protein
MIISTVTAIHLPYLTLQGSNLLVYLPYLTLQLVAEVVELLFHCRFQLPQLVAEVVGCLL